MRITTKFGDKGKTRTCEGRIVAKCDPRIKVQSALDELVSVLGLAKTKIKNPVVKKNIRLIQKDLFRIAASISAGEKKSDASEIKDSDIKALERLGDRIESRMRLPKTFIVPGVNERSAVLHIARAVARRTECCLSELSAKLKVNACIPAYLNRLSDLLFVLAVYEEGKSDTI